MNQDIDNNWNELLNAFKLGLIKDEGDKEIEYRIYYDESGNIVKTTGLKSDTIHDQNYIIVDAITYNEFIKSPYYKVINNQLKKFNVSQTGHKHQLVKSDSGYKVVKNNPALLLDEEEVNSQFEYYDRRN